MIKKQFTLYLENKPGVLAAVTKKLAAENINIEGLSVSESTDVGLVQIVVSNVAATKKVLNAAKVPFSIQDISLITLPNRPGSLCDLVTMLAKQKVNVNYVYATTCDCKEECACHVVISAPDLAKVEKAWKAIS